MKKQMIQIGNDFAVDAVEYASRANAILGIRDSGKTYTATLIAEQLYYAGIPFFAFDPIGRWRFLRYPRRGAHWTGFPVVVAGGAAPDLPLMPADSAKLVRAAMKAGVSMVIDLYDAKLSKKDWRVVVRESIETILYENEALGGGLRHVFLEEAAEFIPQHVRDGQTYAAVEKLARMGGNAGVGVTIINQRAEEVNKAVLELCDNLLLHRQRGKNSLLSLRKWLEAGNVQPPKQITDKISDLPTGECFAWFRDVGHPVLVRVAEKASFDPNRREMAAKSRLDSADFKQVDVSAFIDRMKAAIAVDGVARARKNPTNDEERQVNEAEAKSLREENKRLLRENDLLTKRVTQLEERLNVGAPLPPMLNSAPPTESTTRSPDVVDMEMIYAEMKRRAQNDPGVLCVLASRPEIEIKVQRHVVEATEKTLRGQVAILIAEKFFDAAATGNSAFNELKRRGKSVAKPSVYRECDTLAELGFLTKENDGYRAVVGMKVNIVEV